MDSVAMGVVVARRIRPKVHILCALFALSSAVGAGAQENAPGVVVASATLNTLHERDAFVGRVVAEQSVDLQARVEGILEQVNFVEGRTVAKGDVLFGIEAQKYQASVDQAQAALNSAQAAAQRDKTDLDRKQALYDKGDIPQSVLDTAKATFAEGQAAVDEASANLKSAQIDLGYTKIISPLDGRIGLSAVDAGNLVNSDSGVLATVTSIDPILVSFFVSEPVLLRERRNGSITPSDIKLTTQITLADGADFGGTGKVVFVGDSVNQDTDTVELRARFANPDGVLLPGQLVTVGLNSADDNKVLTVPRIAVQFDKKGYFVFSVDDKNTAHRRDIQIGSQGATRTQVTSGLKAGDRVVVQGLQKIHDGLVVTPVDSQS